MLSKNKTVLLIAGPTAVGKTAVAVQVARHLCTEVISADSRQCFHELNIGVARPSPEELASVPHHFIASHSIHQKVTAATFEEYALEKANDIFQKKDVAVMVGGTGLYINAFCHGMDYIPEVPQEIHESILNTYKVEGLMGLQEEIKTIDPRFWSSGETQNPQRLMRALEVVKATGKSILDFRKGGKKERPFNVIKIGLELPKEILHANINNRVEKMMEKGLLDEVRSLLPYKHLNALQTVGYKELFPVVSNQMLLPEAIEEIEKNTRQYAKRQLTWFKKDEEFTWVRPDAAEVLKHIENVAGF